LLPQKKQKRLVEKERTLQVLPNQLQVAFTAELLDTFLAVAHQTKKK